MNSYVIERLNGAWVLRLSGHEDAMISGPTVESAKEQAFEYVREWAPCRIQVRGEVSEEWTLEHPNSEWRLI